VVTRKFFQQHSPDIMSIQFDLTCHHSAAPYPTGSPIPTAGASTMAGSALFAAAAGIAAVLFV
jgi:hypothetical protein